MCFISCSNYRFVNNQEQLMTLITIATKNTVLHEYGKQRKYDSRLINFFGVKSELSECILPQIDIIQKLFHG